MPYFISEKPALAKCMMAAWYMKFDIHEQNRQDSNRSFRRQRNLDLENLCAVPPAKYFQGKQGMRVVVVTDLFLLLCSFLCVGLLA